MNFPNAFFFEGERGIAIENLFFEPLASFGQSFCSGVAMRHHFDEEIAFEQEIAGFYSRYAHQSWKNVISIGEAGEFSIVPRWIENKSRH